MSIQAVGWALRQTLPPTPKLVLLALCNRADEDTGECWPGLESVAKHCSLSRRSVITYIAALVRNGYVMKQAMRGKDGKQRTNHYWILFDRPAAEWAHPGADDELAEPEVIADDTQDIAEPSANSAPGESGENDAPRVQAASPGPSATAFTRHKNAEPSVLEPSPTGLVERGPSPIPTGFDPTARAAQVERLRAAEEARKPKRVPVIEGSDPWKWWVRNGHPSALIAKVEVKGKLLRGWYFPSLYPPKESVSTGPPHGLQTPEDDLAELAREFGS